MPSVNKTPNYGLNQWAGNEYAKRQDFVDDNEIIDAALKANADASAPTSIRGTLLTGLSTATNAVITAADSILTALGKLQKQITDHKATTQDSLDAKVDKVVGKQLSTEDYTTAYKNKLEGIEAGATADQSASEVPYDNSTSGLAAEDTQGAIDEVNADLVAHKAESASKHIAESGSNANGDYIKFDDGTMICTSNQWCDNAITIATGSVFRNNQQTWVYPASFIERPHVIATPSNNSSQEYRGFVATALPTASANNSCGFTFFYATSAAVFSNLFTSLVAIGRWK